MSQTDEPQAGTQQAMPARDDASNVVRPYPNPDLEIPADPNAKHERLVVQTACAARAAWILGALLTDMKATCSWQKLIGVGPFQDWSHYIATGLHVSHTQADKYMTIARFPMWVTDSAGIERAWLLRRICDMTEVDETPEEAVSLELPIAGGGHKPFRDMGVDEVAEAYRLMRDEMKLAKRPSRPEHPSEHAELQQRAAVAVESWLKADQVRVRNVRGERLMDLHSIPETSAADIFQALATVMRERQ